jgi:hypothetical protein
LFSTFLYILHIKQAHGFFSVFMFVPTFLFFLHYVQISTYPSPPTEEAVTRAATMNEAQGAAARREKPQQRTSRKGGSPSIARIIFSFLFSVSTYRLPLQRKQSTETRRRTTRKERQPVTRRSDDERSERYGSPSIARIMTGNGFIIFSFLFSVSTYPSPPTDKAVARPPTTNEPQGAPARREKPQQRTSRKGRQPVDSTHYLQFSFLCFHLPFSAYIQSCRETPDDERTARGASPSREAATTNDPQEAAARR